MEQMDRRSQRLSTGHVGGAVQTEGAGKIRKTREKPGTREHLEYGGKGIEGQKGYKGDNPKDTTVTGGYRRKPEEPKRTQRVYGEE